MYIYIGFMIDCVDSICTYIRFIIAVYKSVLKGLYRVDIGLYIVCTCNMVKVLLFRCYIYIYHTEYRVCNTGLVSGVCRLYITRRHLSQQRQDSDAICKSPGI